MDHPHILDTAPHPGLRFVIIGVYILTVCILSYSCPSRWALQVHLERITLRDKEWRERERKRERVICSVCHRSPSPLSVFIFSVCLSLSLSLFLFHWKTDRADGDRERERSCLRVCGSGEDRWRGTGRPPLTVEKETEWFGREIPRTGTTMMMTSE